MNIEEIRKNAPPSATHYDTNGFYYKKRDSGRWLFRSYGNKKWNACLVNINELKPLF